MSPVCFLILSSKSFNKNTTVGFVPPITTQDQKGPTPTPARAGGMARGGLKLPWVTIPLCVEPGVWVKKVNKPPQTTAFGLRFI